jgi:hypothetical protein
LADPAAATVATTQFVSKANLLLTITAAALLALGIPRAIDSVQFGIADEAQSPATARAQAAALEAVDGRWHDPLASIRAASFRLRASTTGARSTKACSSSARSVIACVSSAIALSN